MNAKITKIGITNDKISGRGGQLLILRYIEKTELYSLIAGVPSRTKGAQTNLSTAVSMS